MTEESECWGRYANLGSSGRFIDDREGLEAGCSAVSCILVSNVDCSSLAEWKIISTHWPYWILGLLTHPIPLSPWTWKRKQCWTGWRQHDAGHASQWNARCTWWRLQRRALCEHPQRFQWPEPTVLQWQKRMSLLYPGWYNNGDVEFMIFAIRDHGMCCLNNQHTYLVY